MNHQTHCGYPAMCNTCRTLRVANRLAARTRCSKCRRALVFYDHESIRPTDDGPPVFEWHFGPAGRSLSLGGGPAHCPACGKRSLRFMEVGFFD